MEEKAPAAWDKILDELATRLTAAIEALDRMIPRVPPVPSVAASEAVGPIVATVESSREADLAQRLIQAEKTIAELRASREGRRTLPVSLQAKQDLATAEPAALDTALASLSMEQRIAVKSQLLRAGLV